MYKMQSLLMDASIVLVFRWGDLMKRMGIYYWFGYPIQNFERFKLIKEAGFDHVMLWWGDEFIEIDGEKAVLPDMARRLGLAVENVHLPYEKVNDIWLDGINGLDMVKFYKSCITDCAAHHIPTAVLHVMDGETPPAPSQIGIDRFKDIIEFAERKNVNIALENLKRPEHLDFIFSNIQSKCLGFCYDSGHENCYSQDKDFLSNYGDRLMALHLHDNDGSADQHRIPGEGTVNWEMVSEKLCVLEYSGAISLEITNEFSKQFTGLSPEEFLKVAYERTYEIFK